MIGLFIVLVLFSANEEVEDVATADLKYLLVSGLRGEVQARVAGREGEARRQDLLQALESYTRCVELGSSSVGPPSSQSVLPPRM